MQKQPNISTINMGITLKLEKRRLTSVAHPFRHNLIITVCCIDNLRVTLDSKMVVNLKH